MPFDQQNEMNMGNWSLPQAKIKKIVRQAAKFTTLSLFAIFALALLFIESTELKTNIGGICVIAGLLSGMMWASISSTETIVNDESITVRLRSKVVKIDFKDVLAVSVSKFGGGHIIIHDINQEIVIPVDCEGSLEVIHFITEKIGQKRCAQVIQYANNKRQQLEFWV